MDDRRGEEEGAAHAHHVDGGKKVGDGGGLSILADDGGGDTRVLGSCSMISTLAFSIPLICRPGRTEEGQGRYGLKLGKGMRCGKKRWTIMGD